MPSKFTEQLCSLMLVAYPCKTRIVLRSIVRDSLVRLLTAQILGVMSNMVYIVYRASYDADVLGPSKTAFPLLIVAYLTVPTELS